MFSFCCVRVGELEQLLLDIVGVFLLRSVPHFDNLFRVSIDAITFA